MRPCFAFSAAASENKAATLSIYDEIGFWGVQASDFRTALSAVKASVINVEINSPGGDVFAGLAIYNMLRASGKEIVVKVMGVAASAASLIAMAGDKIIMPKNTFMMVHNPWSFAMGNAEELRDTADTLDKIGVSLLNTYVNRTGKTEEEIKPLLAKDTWLTADEALEMGFADEVVADIKANAKFDMKRAELPANVAAAIKAAATTDDPEDPDADPTPDPEPTPEPTPTVEGDVPKAVHTLAIAAGLEEVAPWLAVKAETEDEGKKLIASAVQIKSLCGFVKKPEAAASYIKAGKSLADVRAALAKSMADEADKDLIKSKQETVTQGSAPGVYDAKSAWGRINAKSQTSKGTSK